MDKTFVPTEAELAERARVHHERKKAAKAKAKAKGKSGESDREVIAASMAEKARRDSSGSESAPSHKVAPQEREERHERGADRELDEARGEEGGEQNDQQQEGSEAPQSMGSLISADVEAMLKQRELQGAHAGPKADRR